MVAVWAEADLVLADEFRDGNVPAQQAPLTCAKLAFAALPDTIQERYFRGDSACHEDDLLGWLKPSLMNCGRHKKKTVRRRDDFFTAFRQKPAIE